MVIEAEPTALSGLGLYLVPGRINDPQRAVVEGRLAEELGFESLWIGERNMGTKEAAVLTGALAAVTARPLIGTGLTGPMRHPLLTASMGTTLQGLSGNRFVLGIGRGSPGYWRAWGMAPQNMRTLTDFASIVRRLWAGERVTYDGPAGHFPDLSLQDRHDGPPPPIILGCIGEKSLRASGTEFDGTILSPYLTIDAVRRQCDIVRNAAADANKSPKSVRVWAPVVIAADLEPDVERAIVDARAVTYFQIPVLGDLLVAANRFDPSTLERLRAHPKLVPFSNDVADGHFHREDLMDVTTLVPRGWMEACCALGTAEQCVETLRAYLETGVDGLVLNASSPDQLRGVAALWAGAGPSR